MSRTLQNRLIFIGLLSVFAILFRLIPHPANFAPVGAVAIMSGYLLPRSYAVWLPVLIMVVSDMIIGTHPLVLWTWGSFALIAVISNIFLHGKKLGNKKIVAAGISSGLLFFVITNFGVWLQSGLYDHTWAGLTQCYINAIPFFRNTLLGDVFFVASFYALYLSVITANNKIHLVRTHANVSQ